MAVSVAGLAGELSTASVSLVASNCRPMNVGASAVVGPSSSAVVDIRETEHIGGLCGIFILIATLMPHIVF